MIEKIVQEKWNKLIENLQQMGSVAVAFSGGVDSTFLLYAAKEALGERVLAVTVACDWVPNRETLEANAYCDELRIRQIRSHADETEIAGFCENPANRCYLCKKVLFSKMKEVAQKEGCTYLIEGSNMDDNGDYRPGLVAIRELGVVSPLQDVELTKEEIRILSKEKGLPTWKKPSFACLASRFVYGEQITHEKLQMVDQAEQKLMDLGFTQFRVRIHGKMARIELPEEELSRLLEADLRNEINAYFRQLGFSYITLDLEGYRTGSMNEVLKG